MPVAQFRVSRFRVPRPRSIRTRVTLAFTCFITFLILLLGIGFFFYLENQQRFRRNLILAQAIVEFKEEINDRRNPLKDVRDVARDEGGDFRALNVVVGVVDKRGVLIAQTPKSALSWPLTGAWRGTSLPYKGYTLVAALPWTKIQHRLDDRVRVLLVMGAVVVFFSSISAWYLVGRTLSPLDGLTRQVSAANTESLHVRLETPSSDLEMVGLVETMNDLLNRLSRTAQLQGRFYSSASHELRTPLQVLNLLHEVTLSRPRSAEEYADALQESHIQILRLTRLVQDLLLLNQLDIQNSTPEPVLVDLADICESELNQLHDIAARRGLQIESPLPSRSEMMAPWTHITMLLRNLMENAVKYASDRGRVAVEVSDHRVRIWNECVIDAGFKAEKYFEPFFRPDAARNSETGGNGLGLSICRAICETNGWHFTLVPEKGGLSATVDFQPRGFPSRDSLPNELHPLSEPVRQI